ncbi:zinc-dependent metalloprotease [Belliella sp. R4-6]|uniref:Zinc-dependent metalloprotease n=1 Tax=Belliella alkalica TaxID=1730871 RepID=A0ABS9V988_9BACT|nr:M57 family metalloprotease [Belliella alkalica]MCH7412996.1 zinc-dependent metalloprotease [Belliella alkalica]
MKIRLTYYVLIVFAIFSCDTLEIKDPISDYDLESEINIVEKDADLKRFLDENGFFNAKVFDVGEFYLIDNCHSVEKDALRNGDYFLKSNPNAQAVTNNLVSGNFFSFRTIRIRVDDSTMPFGGIHDWRPEITQAINDLNSVRNFRLRFELVSDGNFDILVRREPFNFIEDRDLRIRVIASAGFPTNGNPGSIIRINTLWGFGLNTGMKRNNMVHEIGHTIGFRHTNWNLSPNIEPSGASGANTIPATYSNDPQSVMNKGTALNVWSGFSLNDIVSFRTIYPFNNQEKPLYTFFRAVPNFNGIFRHWWTGNWLEGTSIITNNQNFLPSGVTGFIYNNPQQGSTPLYRHYSAGMDSYYLSTNSSEQGFINSTVIGHAYNSPGQGRIPVYLWFHPNEGHYISTNQNDARISGSGWVGGNVSFYVEGWF